MWLISLPFQLTRKSPLLRMVTSGSCCSTLKAISFTSRVTISWMKQHNIVWGNKTNGIPHNPYKSNLHVQNLAMLETNKSTTIVYTKPSHKSHNESELLRNTLWTWLWPLNHTFLHMIKTLGFIICVQCPSSVGMCCNSTRNKEQSYSYRQLKLTCY